MDQPIIAGCARFTVIARECLRLEWQTDGRFTDQPTLFVEERPVPWPGARVERDGPRVVVDTGTIRLEFTDDGKPFHAGNLRARIARDRVESWWRPGQADLANLGGTLATLDGVDRPRDPGDGLLSASGWGLIDDSATHLLVDGWAAPRTGGGTDWYLFGYGHDFRAALAALARLAGPMALPRRCTLGSWYSRWWKYTSDDYRAIIAGYREYGFGLDVLVFDMDWHTQDDATTGFGWAWTKGWTGWTWNRALLPDAETLLGECKSQGLAVTLNAHPHDGVRHHEACYGDFMRRLGRDPASGEDLPFRAGDRAYLDAYFQASHVPHERAGVDFWWVDWQQDRHLPEVDPIPGLSHLRWLNRCYYHHSAAGGRRGLSFSRWGGWGDHRHPIQFSGDITALWTTLAYEVAFTATAVAVGCCTWSHDIGGFCGRRDGELYARWAQFGAISAALRMHSATDELDRRPWLWEPAVVEALRGAFAWRSRLIPAIYSAMHRGWSEAVPCLRPLWFDHPAWGPAWSNPQTVLLADHLIAAPVALPGTGPGLTSPQVAALPPGEWAHLGSDERFAGGCHLTVSTLDEFPLFVRAGAPVVLGPDRAGPGPLAGPLTAPALRIHVPARDGTWTTTLVEDDGDSDGYRTGACARRCITVVRRDGDLTIAISAAAGTWAGQPTARSWTLELRGVAGAPGGRLDLDLGLLREDTPWTRTWTVAAAGPALARQQARERRLTAILGRHPAGDPLDVASTPQERWGVLALLGATVLPLHLGPRVADGGRLHLLLPAGLADDNRARVVVDDEVDGVVERRDLGWWGAGSTALPAIPDLADPPAGGWAHRRVHLTLERQGRRVEACAGLHRRQGGKN